MILTAKQYIYTHSMCIDSEVMNIYIYIYNAYVDMVNAAKVCVFDPVCVQHIYRHGTRSETKYMYT